MGAFALHLHDNSINGKLWLMPSELVLNVSILLLRNRNHVTRHHVNLPRRRSRTHFQQTSIRRCLSSFASRSVQQRDSFVSRLLFAYHNTGAILSLTRAQLRHRIQHSQRVRTRFGKLHSSKTCGLMLTVYRASHLCNSSISALNVSPSIIQY